MGVGAVFWVCLEPATGPGQVRVRFDGSIDGFAGIPSFRGDDTHFVRIVPFHQFRHIKFGFLQDFNFPDVTILDGKNRTRRLRNLIADRGRNQFFDQTLEVTLGAEFGHVGTHFGPDRPDLRTLRVTRRTYLIVLRFRKGDTKQTDRIAIGRPAIHIAFNNRLFLANEGTQLVAGHIHPVEIEQTIVPLDILNTQFNFAIREGFILLQIGQRHFDDPTFQIIGRNFLSRRFGNQGLATILDGKNRRCN